MWDIVVVKKTDDKYIVMTPNGDFHCINEDTLNLFKRNGRVNYDSENIKY